MSEHDRRGETALFHFGTQPGGVSTVKPVRLRFRTFRNIARGLVTLGSVPRFSLRHKLRYIQVQVIIKLTK